MNKKGNPVVGQQEKLAAMDTYLNRMSMNGGVYVFQTARETGMRVAK